MQWVGSAIQGDLGTSFSGRNASGTDRSREVIDLLAPRLWNTLFLASITAIVAVPISLFLGITSALYRNSIYDRTVNTTTLTTISFPEFFVAYILILLLSSLYPVFPSLANVDASTPFTEQASKGGRLAIESVKYRAGPTYDSTIRISIEQRVQTKLKNRLPWRRLPPGWS